MKTPTLNRPLTVKLAALSAALAAFVTTSQAQVTFSQVTNGLAVYYPLDFVRTNGSTVTTPDYILGRDMILLNMNSTNVIASTRPTANSASVSNCFNFNQQASGIGTTIMYYVAKPQNPLDGSGDFLPFMNQINATMSFWIKSTANTAVNAYNDKRFFGECDNSSGQAGPICLLGTSSGGGLPTDQFAHFLFRQQSGSPGADIPQVLVDGSSQVPNLANHWTQGGSYTSNSILDGNWHLFTVTIDSNRVMDVYVDGVRDPGPPGPAFTDVYGNPSYGPALPLTNYYYTSNSFPAAGVANPPPNGYVRWVWNALFKSGNTVFGGFRRNGGNTGGFPMLIDDIAFWNRQLSVEEIEFVRTNGLYDVPLYVPLQINSFTADFSEVGQGDSVTLRWVVSGASTNVGGISISGVGDVTSAGSLGSASTTLSDNQTYTFTLTIHNGIEPDKTASVTVKSFRGVSSDWHLIQRFDGVFSDGINDPQGGISGNGWVSSGSDFSGSFDKWNVFTITNNGAMNKAIGPRTGYNPNVSSLTGFESRGALSYARLGSLAMLPGQTNTLFFRFALREPEPFISTNTDPATVLVSDLDFCVGLSDYGFLGPSGGLGYYGGTGGGFGPYFSLIRNSGGLFAGAPFDLFAPDTADPADTNTAGTFSYVASVDPNGLQTNVNYLVWMDIWNRDTHAGEDPVNPGTTNTLQQAQYSVWLQKQGEPSRTLLFTNFHGNRNYVGFNPVNDDPTPVLDKVYFNVGSQSIVNAAAGAYTATNMIAIDDIYLSKSGVNSTIPRLFEITSIVKGTSNVTLNWNSLGSLFATTTYTIQRKLNLDDPNWTSLATIPSGGETTTYVDNTVGANSSAFYRIVWP